MRPSETFYGFKSVDLSTGSCPTCGRKTKVQINPFRIIRTLVGLTILIAVGFGFVDPGNDTKWTIEMGVGLLMVDIKLFTAFKGK